MADAFTPKFADLVRNTTTTVGTGNFILGPAVQGFSGFMTALEPGDRFYYSAIGVDRPSEREIGRGTLMPDGTISRQAIDGTPTNFTSGTKTIALVAAAEWFETIQAGGATTGGGTGSGQLSAATRTELSRMASSTQTAMLREDGREGLFEFRSGDLSDAVGRDPAQAVHVALESDPSGASGAWVRVYDGPLNLQWFGAKPGQDIVPAVQALLAFAGPISVSAFVPPSEIAYRWNSSVRWNASASLFSQKNVAILSAVREGFLHGALIDFPAGVTPIVVGNTDETYGSGASFSGLSFRASGQANTTATGAMAQDGRTLTLTAPGDFKNGQIICVPGAGTAGYLQGNGLRASTTAGSPKITTNIEHAAIVGMVIDVGGAFPANSRVIAADRAAKTITLSANATASVSSQSVTLHGDLYGMIMSGGGTTTLELTTMAHRAVSGAVVRHYDCAIFGFGGYHLDGVTCEGQKGAAFAMVGGARYRFPDATSSGWPNANCCYWNGVSCRTGTNGILIDGTDANACHISNANTITTTGFGIIDQSFLGNRWDNVHVSGGYGILHVCEPSSQSQFDWAYTEGGTLNSFASSACGTGYQSAWEDGGVRFNPWNGVLYAPSLGLYPHGSTVQAYSGLSRSDGNGLVRADFSGAGGSTVFNLFDSHRTGIIGITDASANCTPMAFTMANHALGAGHSLVNSLLIGDGGQTAGSINTAKFRRVVTGSGAPAAGAWSQGDIVINSAPTASAVLYWRCIGSGTPGNWEAVSPGGGPGGVSDGDKGDISVSGGGTSWKVEAASGNFSVAGDFQVAGRVTAIAGGSWVTPQNGEGYFYAHPADGLFFAGRGSATDCVFANKNGATVWDIPSGTTTVRFKGNVDVAGALAIGGTQVVAARQAAIADLASDATTADVIAKLNATLAMLRTHGLIGS